MIKIIKDAGITWTIEYSGDKIARIMEQSGGSKPISNIHTFEITADKWIQTVTGSQNRVIEYRIESGRIMERKNGAFLSKMTYSGQLLQSIEYQNHYEDLTREELEWNNSKLYKVKLFTDDGFIETREIICTDEPNVLSSMPKEFLMVLYDTLGHLYFFSHHNFASFSKYHINSDKIFSRYDIRYINMANGDLAIQRVGSNGAKSRTDVTFHHM